MASDSKYLFRVLDVRPGEGLPIIFLLAFSLCGGVFVAFFLSAANASFLSQYDIRLLPFAYMASGGVGYAVTWLFTALQKRLAFSRLALCTLLFLFALLSSFALAFTLSDVRWLSFLLFVAIEPMLALLDLSFWGLAGRLFDLQQGKRLYGLVSSGEVISSILGFLTVPVLIYVSGDFSLLLVIATGGLGGCVLVMILLGRGFRQRLGARPTPKGQMQGESQHPLERRYFVLLSLVLGLIVLSLYFIDFAFLRQTSQLFEGEAALAQFLSIFYAINRFVELVTKTLLSGRLLTHFGLLFGLLSLPGGVLLCAALAVLTGTTAGTAGIAFFVPVMAAKLLEFVLRRSTFEPSFKVLFQPLAPVQRFFMQSRVEGGVRQLAVFAAGGSLALVGLSRALGPRELMYILIFLALAALSLTVLVFREYRNKLLQALSRHGDQTLVKSPVEMIQELVHTSSAEKVGYVLSILEQVDPGLFEGAVIDLLQSDEVAIRCRALERIAESRLVAALEPVRQLVGQNRDRETKWAAVRTLDALEEVRSSAASVPRVVALARSSQESDRRLAATVLNYTNGSAPLETLAELMWDPDPGVRRQALLAAGRVKRPEYWPRLVEQLSSGIFCKAAMAGLIAVGEPVLQSLDFSCKRFEDRPETLVRILRVYERVGGRAAEELLFARIDSPNGEVERQALVSLSVLGHQVVGERIGVVRQKIEEVIDRITWYLAAQLDLGTGSEVEKLQQALEWQVQRDRESLFLLLALICDCQAIRLMRDSLAGEGLEARAYALEIASEVLPSELHEALFPILEQLRPSQTLERLDLLFPQGSLSRVERLKDVLSRGKNRVNSWTRACAIRALIEVGDSVLPRELVANLFSAETLVQDTAAWGIERLDPGAYEDRLRRLPELEAEALLSRIQAGNAGRLLPFETVVVLDQTDVLSSIPVPILARFASGLRQRQFRPGEAIFAVGEVGRSMFVVAAGEVRIERDGRQLNHVGRLEVLGEIAVLESGVRTASAVADGPTLLLEVEREWIHSLLSENMEVLPGIINVITERLVG